MDEEKILTLEEKKRILEAVLFAAGHPVTFDQLSEVIGISPKEIASLVAEYAEEYDVDVDEIIEEAKVFEEDEDDSEIEIELIIADDETESLKAQEFDINID